MASSLHNLSEYNPQQVPSTDGMRFGIVVSEWNSQVTGALLEGARDTLRRLGVSDDRIMVKTVPGSFELIFGSAQMVKSGLVDAVIAIGCVIRGDTPHFDYICQGATHGISELNLHGDVPVIYGLLTCNTLQQALDRAGGTLGNKGDEAAITAIKMVEYKRQLRG